MDPKRQKKNKNHIQFTSFPKNNFKLNKSNILDIGRNYQTQNNNYDTDYK
jgi:hypothetical protein